MKEAYVKMIVAGLLLLLAFGSYLLNTGKEKNDKGILQLEQRVACYKGCQFLGQPIFNLTTEQNMDIRISQYNNCTEMCDDYYRKP